jgi:hypothetical protein
MNLLQSTDDFRPYLFSDERIVWRGEPKQGLVLTGRDAFLIPLSLVWGGFAIFWNVSVWSFPGAGPPLFFRLFGLPFLIIGLYFILGRFFHDAHIRKTMSYAVTDQRVLVVRGSKVMSLDIHRLPRLELSEHNDGTGTLTFEAGNNSMYWGGMNGFRWWVPSLNDTAQFFRIDDPRRVYEIIRNQSRA